MSQNKAAEKSHPVKLVEATRLRCQGIRVNKGNPSLLASHSEELLNSYGERCSTHVTSIMLFNSYHSMLEVLSSPLHRWRNRSTEKLDNLLKFKSWQMVDLGFTSGIPAPISVFSSICFLPAGVKYIIHYFLVT